MSASLCPGHRPRYAPAAVKPALSASHPSGGGVPITVAPAPAGHPWGRAFILARGRIIANVRNPKMAAIQVGFYRSHPEIAEFLAAQGEPYRWQP